MKEQFVDVEKFIQWVIDKYPYSTMDVPLDLASALRGFPEADVELVRHGTWKERYFSLPLSDSSRHGYECSVCLTHWDCTSNYCPYCGAKNERETKNETLSY